MALYVNCTTTDVDATTLVRLLLVDSEGEPFITCDNDYLSDDDLIRLLIGTDESGNPALRVYIE